MPRPAAVPTAIIALAALLGGCAQSYQPIVDMKGVDAARYQQDLTECRAYAEQVSPGAQAALGGAGGALFGGALGAVAGAFGGGAATGAAFGAGLGGVTGAAGGGVRGGENQKQVIANCLRHRGYAVLS